uniref:Synaptopodin-2-like n=1 Tax=Kryptolebias marmoratus TaxID=37003 RepID=A0A3Q3F1S9_KRYMA
MGTGDYICVTLRGGAPWGFTLQEGEGDTYRPFLVSQGGHASLAGVQEGDEVVSINGEPCADLTLLRAFALIDTSIDSLQLLVKRYKATFSEALESTTLHIFSSKHRSNVSGELYTSESQGESRCGELDADTEVLRGPDLHLSDTFGGHELVFKKYNEEVRRSFSPGDMVELQVSLSEQNLDDGGCSSLVSARGIEGELSSRDVIETIHTTSITSHYLPCPAKEPLRQRGVVVRSPSSLGQQEGIPQQPAEASGAGRGVLRVGGPEVSDSDGEQCEGAPESFTISFQIPSEEAATGEEQDSDSDGDQEKPNKHRARHARLRRNESLSEKQVKEVKSKCKRIALLLSAAPPNPNNKGVLMFKKHRQRAKKFTLVSYGTGEDEPEFSDEEEEIHGDNIHKTLAGELTFEASANSKSDKPFFSHAPSSKGAITLNLDKSLLEIKRDLNNQAEMESLPDTKGKGALMFAQRRLRMDEISAEHDELRRQGIPVEGVQETEKKVAEHSYMQSQMQHYSTNINGTVQHQTNEIHSSFSNRTAKPFTAENMVATPYSHAASGTNQDGGQGEQIASRDERISTPAIKTGLLDSRRKTVGKPMFTFKEAPKVSPSPVLLNLLNRSDKKGFESGPEEDYLSLGAEACNFLQSQRVKHKIPPPVAPKPMINPNSFPWSSQIEAANQDMPQCQTSLNVPTSTVNIEHVPKSTINIQPSPKPWLSPQNQTPPPPPQRMHSFTIGQKASSPINPMATVLNPKSTPGSAYEMPLVRGKGADMFAKRQSRMEKFVVDSETVEANKASRSTSPAASLPNEWKYTPNVRAPPTRAFNPIQSPFYPPAATKQLPANSPVTKTKKKDQEKKMPAPKPLNVIDVMKHQPYKLDSSLFIFGSGAEAAKPPTPKPSCSPPNPLPDNQPIRYEQMAPTWSQSRSQSRAPIPSFVSPTRSPVSTPASHVGYRSLPRQWRPQKYMAEANQRPLASLSQSNRPSERQTYKSVYTSSTWSWRR